MTRRLLVIGNANAGSNDRLTLNLAMKTLGKGADVELVETAGLDELDEALGGRGDRDLVVVGGDGSMHAVLQVLQRRGELGGGGPLLGLIPLGTGNDLARALGLPLHPVRAARVVLEGTEVPVEVLVDDEGSVVANAVHIGMGEEAGRIAAPWKEALGKVRLGILGYAVGGVGALFGWRGRKLEVRADDEVLADGSRRVLQVAVAVGTSVGGGTLLAPQADPSDGRAEVVVCFADSPMRRLRYVLRLGHGGHTRLDDVTRTTARSVTVAGRTEFATNADGERSDPVHERSWTALTQAYRLTVPQRTANDLAGPADHG